MAVAATGRVPKPRGNADTRLSLYRHRSPLNASFFMGLLVCVAHYLALPSSIFQEGGRIENTDVTKSCSATRIMFPLAYHIPAHIFQIVSHVIVRKQLNTRSNRSGDGYK